jgi:hypothetical protein
VTDEQRGYRKELPLAEIIPPDRRRLKAAALVLGGMLAGAGLLAFVQDVTKPEKPVEVAPSPPRETDIRSFAVGIAVADITSPRAGQIDSDGQPDQSFDLVVDGPIASIRIASVDSAGHPFGTSSWGTSGDPRPWQLAVFEDGTPLNGLDGSLRPLPDGRHRLRLYASDNGSFEPGSYFRAYVVRPDTRVAVSEPLAFTGHGPAHEKPKPRIPPSEQAPASPAFDRGAAASALGWVDVSRCRSESGVDGTGHVTVVFANDGSVSHAEVDRGGNEKTARGACIAKAFEKARIPAYAGARVRVGKSFTLGPPRTGPE